MYGILATCIAVMAMFLGLFALSVEPTTNDLQDRAPVEVVQTSLGPTSSQ